MLNMDNLPLLPLQQVEQTNFWGKCRKLLSPAGIELFQENMQNVLQSEKKFDAQLQTAQLPARQQIDNRIDKNLAGLDAKVLKQHHKRNSQKSIHQKGGTVIRPFSSWLWSHLYGGSISNYRYH